MPRQGSCQCGQIQFEIDFEDRLGVLMCFCTECHKVAAGPSTYSVVLKSESFRMIRGETRSWERKADSGNRNIAYFCPECGNRIIHVDPDTPEIVRLKAGCLDDSHSLEPDGFVWTRSAPDWLTFPEGSFCHPTQPTMAEMLAAMEQRKEAQ